MDRYNEKEFIEKYNKTIKRLVDFKESSKNPKVFILGGQPGSGKTKLTNLLIEKSDEDIIVLNGDEFKKLHPRHKELQKEFGDEAVTKTQEFSGKMTESLIEELSNKKYNLIIEGTLRTDTVPLNTEKKLKDKGYITELSVIAVKPELSYVGTLKRYEDMIDIGTTPRTTLKEHHDMVVNGILINLEKIYEQNKFNNITLYNRDGENLYDMKKLSINPKEVLDKEFTRKMTKTEENQYLNDLKIVFEKMEKRNDPKQIEIFELIEKAKKTIIKINSNPLLKTLKKSKGQGR